MLAACGVGKGYYKPGQEPYTFTNHNHFFRLKGIGYNRLSRHRDSEGLVSLILNTPASQIKLTERTKVGFFFNNYLFLLNITLFKKLLKILNY